MIEVKKRKKYTEAAIYETKKQIKYCKSQKNCATAFSAILIIAGGFLLFKTPVAAIVLIALGFFIFKSQKEYDAEIDELNAALDEGIIFSAVCVHIVGFKAPRNEPCSLILKRNGCEFIICNHIHPITYNQIKHVSYDNSYLTVICKHCKIILESQEAKMFKRIIKENMK